MAISMFNLIFSFRNWISFLQLSAFLIILGACKKETKPEISDEKSEVKRLVPSWKSATQLRYEVEQILPHDSDAFTQGLELHEGDLFESTGLVGKSSIRRIDRSSGKTKIIKSLSSPHFGEGLTELDGLIYQLTWTCKKGFVYDADTLQLKKTFSYQGEGWGICNDSQYLFISDGTNEIRVYDPKTMNHVHTVPVTWNGQALSRLNELEYVEGEIFANIWGAEQIARIDPRSGKVIGWIDFKEICEKQPKHSPDHVLNGIAYDQDSGLLYVTGKCWPNLYGVRLLPK